MPFSQCDSLLEGIMKLVKCFMYVVIVLTNPTAKFDLLDKNRQESQYSYVAAIETL